MTLGERIIFIRGDLSREKFAPLSGVSKNTLIFYEKNERQPGADYLAKLLELYPGISPAWLLMGEGEMRRGDTGAGQTQSAVNTGGNVNQVASGHHDGDVYIYNSSPEPHAAKPEIAELVVLLDRYANKALLEELKGKLLNIKKVMEG